MGNISRIAMITSGYPCVRTPTALPFVKQLAHALARQEVKVTVVNPIAFHHLVNRADVPFEVDETEDESSVHVMRPRFLSLSARDEYKLLGPLNPGKFTIQQFTSAAQRAIEKFNVNPDVLYGHFLYPGGAAAVRLGRQWRIPSVVGVGEGEFWTTRRFGLRYARREFCRDGCFVANSSDLAGRLKEHLQLSFDRIVCLPNGVDRRIFHPHDRMKVREEWGIPEELFVVVCVGNYLHKKGPSRVAKAIDGLGGVAGIYAGSGSKKPVASNTLFAGRVDHEKMPSLLSACDLFVLPTLVEGCSNALIEAMACGLPIISSDLPFNDDILEQEFSIRVDPEDVNAIRKAVLMLKDNAGRRRRMSVAALKKAETLDINMRAAKILEFVEGRKKQ